MPQQPDDVRTRLTTPEEWRAWRDLRLRSLAADPDAFGSTWEREAGFDEGTWRSRLAGTGGPAVLAYAGGTPVGLGAGWVHRPGHMMVVAMWTDPDWRGLGVGGKVLDRVVRWGVDRGLTCDLWVADGNPARRLYERYGFRPDGAAQPLREGSTLTKRHLVLSPGSATAQAFRGGRD